MEFRRILVRATNWVGDAVMSLPALHALRAAYPHAHIAILARPWVAGLYGREPFCDEVIPYEAGKGWRELGTKARIAVSLGDRRFDCAILLQNAFEAAAVAWMAHIPVRIGYNRDGRGRLLTNPIPVPKPGEIPVHQRFYYLELLKRGGLIPSYPPDVEIRLTAGGSAARDGQALLTGAGLSAPFLGVSPGAAFGSAKRWLPERFAESAVKLARRRGSSVAIFGSKEETAIGELVAREIGHAGVPVRNLAGKTSLREFIEMVAACELFLTNDSGSMHIASALGVPTVVVFGPTDETATGPAGRKNAILREPVECSPCHRRECPIDHRCMTRVTADRAVEAGLELLK
jgi:heptosyltransferase-2